MTGIQLDLGAILLTYYLVSVVMLACAHRRIITGKEPPENLTQACYLAVIVLVASPCLPIYALYNLYFGERAE